MKIISFGDSFTFGSGLDGSKNQVNVSEYAYPQQLANMLDAECNNYALPGGSNKEIMFKILGSEISKDDIVTIMWTHHHRNVILRKDLSKLGDALGDKLGAWLINNPSINANEHKDLSETKRIANAYYKYVHDDYDSLKTSWLYIDYANRFLQDKAKQVIHCIIPEVYEFNTNPPNWTSVINFHRFHQYWEENPRTPCNHAGPEAHKKFAKHLARLIT